MNFVLFFVRYHMTKGDSEAVLTCCKRFGHQEPSLWVQALWTCIRDNKNPPEELLSEVSKQIQDNEKRNFFCF